MNVYEIRRTRLRELIDNRFAGVVLHCATALELKPPQLHRWLSDSQYRRDMHEESARSIEAKLGLPTGWLDSFTGEKPLETAQSRGNSVSSDTDNHSTDPQEAEAVVIDWDEVDDFDTAVRTPGARELLRKVRTSKGRGFALRMREDSMLPTLPVGSLVLIDPDEPPAHNRVVLVGEPGAQPMLRRLVIQGSQQMLKADNDRYGPLTPMHARQHIIGVAIDAVVRLI